MQAVGPQEKPASFQARGARVVTDPITRTDVVITDASPYAVVDPQMLTSLSGLGFSTRALPRRKLKKHDELYTSVHPAQPSNSLLYPFPPHTDPNVPQAPTAMRPLFEHLIHACGLALVIVWMLTVAPDVHPGQHTSWARVWFRFTYRTLCLLALAAALRYALLFAAQKIEDDLHHVRARMYQARGTRYPPPVPESAEWLNNFLMTLWRQLDPQQFLPIADSIEGTINSFLPSFITGVKFDDLGFGLRPPQVVSVRGLADLMTDLNYPRETWMNPGAQTRKRGSMEKDSSGLGRTSTNSPAGRPSSQSQSNHKGSEKNNHGTAPSGKNSEAASIYPRQSQTGGEEAKDNHIEKSETGPPTHVDSDEDMDGDGVPDDEESGDFLNYEMALVYDALDHQHWTDSSAGMYTGASSHIHVVVNILFKLFGWKIAVPIWTAVEQFALTVRLRAQLISEPPYMRNVSVALLGIPRVSVSVRPFSSWSPNLVDLPFVHRFVQSTLSAVCQPYMIPKSITLNLAEMMAGEGVKKETDAVGVVAVQVMAADGLSSQDANGYSDPYIIISLAKFGRPLYSTRIIFKDLNPVWNETAFVLITKDDIMAEEKISLQLWDSDMHTADDIVGRAAKNVIDLMKTPNQFIEFTESLMGFEDADSMAGRLTYRIGFFELSQFSWEQREKAVQLKVKEAERASKKKGRAQSKTPEQIQADRDYAREKVLKHAKKEEEKNRQAADSKDSPNPEAIAQQAALEARAPQPARENTNVFGNHTDDHGLDASNSPPDPKWPSGVLRIGVENIEGLELRGSAVRDAGDEDRLPSSYCEVIVDGEVVHTTRVRQYTNMPFFDSSIELFVRDWRQCTAIICVRDAVFRAHDPIIGCVSLHLPDLLTKSSQLSQRFQLEHGVGVGKVSIDLLFRSVSLRLPRGLLGAQAATVELLSPITIELLPSSQVENHRARRKARHIIRKASFVAVGRQIKRLDSNILEIHSATDDATGETTETDADNMTFTTHATGANDESDAGMSTASRGSSIRFGVYDRYSAALGFLFGGPGGLGAAGGPVAAVGDRLTNRRSDAIAMCWLADLQDDVETWAELPLVVGKSLEVLSRNYLAPATLSSAEEGQFYNCERDAAVPSSVAIEKPVREMGEVESTPGSLGSQVAAQHHEYERIGTLKVKMVVRSGLADAHASTLKSDAGIGQNAKHAYEVFAHLHPDAVRKRNWRLDLGFPDLGLGGLGLNIDKPGQDGGKGLGRVGSLFSTSSGGPKDNRLQTQSKKSPSARFSSILPHKTASQTCLSMKRQSDNQSEVANTSMVPTVDGRASNATQPTTSSGAVVNEQGVLQASQDPNASAQHARDGDPSTSDKSLKGSLKSAARKLSLRPNKQKLVSDA